MTSGYTDSPRTEASITAAVLVFCGFAAVVPAMWSSDEARPRVFVFVSLLGCSGSVAGFSVGTVCLIFVGRSVDCCLLCGCAGWCVCVFV